MIPNSVSFSVPDDIFFAKLIHLYLVSFGKEMEFGDDIEHIAKCVAGMEKKRNDPERIVVITCGPEPVVIAVGPNKIIKVPVKHMDAKDIIDTNGAGDAFVGGFISQMVRGKSLEECSHSGSKIAQIVIKRLGCTFPNEAPSLDELCK